jgi:preprotein translocase subunit YajC
METKQMWFEGIAWAAAAAAPAAGPQSFFDQMLGNPVVPLVMVVAVFYFIVIRPQSQRTSEHQKVVKGLKKNDEVVTNGGIVGRVAEMSDNLITLEIAPNVRVRIERAEIKGLSSYGKAQSKKEKND